MTPRKPAIAFIFVTLMLDVLGFGLLIPVAPKLIQQLQGGTEQTAAGAVGMLAATYALMQLLFAPVLGALSDRFGRRPVILCALLGSGIDYLVMAVAPTLSVLYITRAISGISGASITAASAYVADVTPPEKRAAGFGMIGAAFGLGFILGPLIGGVLGDMHIRYPFYAAAALTLVNWLFGVFVLPESLPRERRAVFNIRRANPIGAFAGLGRYPIVAGLSASFFFVYLAQFGLHTTWVLYTSHRYGWTARDVGFSLFAVGIGAAIVQGGLARRIIPALGERRSLMIGMAIAVMAYLGYGFAPRGWMLYPIIAFGSLAGIVEPAAQSLITRTVKPTEQGTTQGALASLRSVANIIGPLIGASVFAYFISDHAPVELPGASFIVGAMLASVGWLAAWWAVTRAEGEPDACKT